MRSKKGPRMDGDLASGGVLVDGVFQGEEIEGQRERNAEGFTRGIDD